MPIGHFINHLDNLSINSASYDVDLMQRNRVGTLVQIKTSTIIDLPHVKISLPLTDVPILDKY